MNLNIDPNWMTTMAKKEDSKCVSIGGLTTDLTPIPGQIFTHREHDPAAGKWREYEVIAIVQPGGESSHVALHSKWFDFENTKNGVFHFVWEEEPGTTYAKPPLETPHVAYKSVKASTLYLRPLSEFMDGRFTLAEK